MQNPLTLKEFPQVNVRIAEDQEEYQTIPAYYHGDTSGTVTFCWKLTSEQIEVVKETGEIWHSVLTFNSPLQPTLVCIDSPFEE
jgi:hypothetical protein